MGRISEWLLAPQPGALPPVEARISRPIAYATDAPALVRHDETERLQGAAAVRRCVGAISTNLASLDLTVLVNGEAKDDHPIASLWNREPNAMMSGRFLKEVLFARMEYRGETFAYLDRGPSGVGPITAIWPIYTRVSPVVARGQAGEDALQGFVVHVGQNKKVPLLPSEVLWLRYPHPDDPWGALAPWKAAQFAAGLDEAARTWQRDEMQRGGTGTNVVYLGDLTQSQHDSAVASWRQGLTSSNRNLLVSGPTPARADRIGMTAVEIGYLESRRANLEEVCLAFGVPLDYLRGGSTFDNQRAAKVTLWTDTLIPKGEIVAGETDRQMLPDPRQTTAFDLSRVDALSENMDSISTRTVALTDSDLLLIDEARASLGLEPLPNGAGQQTLTAYRLAIPTGPPPLAGAVGRVSPPRDRLLLTRAGTLRIDPHPRPVPGRPADLRVSLPDAAEVLRAYRRHERAGVKAMRRLAEKQRRVVLRNAGKTRSIRANADDLFDTAYWQRQTVDALESFMAGVWEDGGSRVASGLGLDFAQFDLLNLVAMQSRLDVLAEVVTATTRTAIDTGLLLPGVAEGEGIDALAARLTSVFDGLSGYRAEAIARTETVGGYNAASRAVAVTSGLVEQRRWLATLDTDTRDTHAALNGHTTNGMSDPYPNGLMHPGDPSGDSKETVNCRCTEVFLIGGQE